MKLQAIAVAAVCTSALLGCATIMQSTTQDVGLSSNPSNATVSIDGRQVGTTPMTTSLKRKDHHLVRIELDGYHPYETTFTRSVSGWVWGNIVFGGLIGLAVDAISGGMYKLTPEQVNAELRSRMASVQDGEDGLYVMVVLAADPSWERIGTMNRTD